MDNIQHTDRIVVGVDGSQSSVEALAYAGRLAAALGAHLEAVTTWFYPGLAEYPGMAAWDPEADAHEIVEDAVRRAFADAPPPGLVTKVVNGPAAKRLIAASEGAAMLVLGSRGHGGFAGLLLGSVSSACAEYAHCPVLVVHPQHAKTSGDAPSGAEVPEPVGA